MLQLAGICSAASHFRFLFGVNCLHRTRADPARGGSGSRVEFLSSPTVVLLERHWIVQMFVHTEGWPRRSWILLALPVLLWVAVAALLGILTPGILSGSLRASGHLALPRVAAVVGAKATGWSPGAVRQAASATLPAGTLRCGALPEPMPSVCSSKRRSDTGYSMVNHFKPRAGRKAPW